MSTDTPYTTPVCDGRAEELLNLYVDGELPTRMQPELFAHLAQCAPCRAEMEAIFRFRLAARQEHIAVPPIVDESFLKRLNSHSTIMGRVDRRAERQPLWLSNRRVSVRSVVISAAAVFMLSLAFSFGDQGMEPRNPHISQSEELVELPTLQDHQAARLPVFVFFPGLTVEADSE